MDVGGDLYPWTSGDDDAEGDDDAGDDDSAAGDDDTSGDDDDSTGGDDDTSGDDDDAAGGHLSCGPTVSIAAGGSDALAVITGEAVLTFDYDRRDDEARGELFSATWVGCEAWNAVDPDGEELCGIRWEVDTESNVAQFQSTSIILRFEMDFVLAESTCAFDHPLAADRTLHYRLSVPYKGEDGVEILWSDSGGTHPSNMDDLANSPYTGQGDEPDEVDLSYQTDPEVAKGF